MLLGWGLWIVHLGLPYLGWSFTLIAVLPGWPYALYDLISLGYQEAPQPLDRRSIDAGPAAHLHGSHWPSPPAGATHRCLWRAL